MIGSLEGLIEEIGKDTILLSVMGIGFEVNVPASLTQTLSTGQRTKLLISMQIREADVSLYGFAGSDEKALFLELINIKGVGPKAALATIGNLHYGEIIDALLKKDPTNFKKVPGVGGKLADRIIAEMQGKPLSRLNHSQIITGSQAGEQTNELIRDAVSALVGLGFNRVQAFAVCKELIQNNSDMTISDIIKHALKELAV